MAIDVMIPFVDLAAQQDRLRSEIEAGIARVLSHGKYILGPEVEELEEKLIAYSGAEHCITCANGTDALPIALMALGVGIGDEVICPGFSYIATAETPAVSAPNAHLPNGDKASKEVLSLPIHPYMDGFSMEKIITALRLKIDSDH